MASLREIAAAVTAALDDVPDLNVYDHPPQGVNPPLAFPVVQGWEPSAMGRAGWVTVDLEIVVLTAATANPKDGYRRLLEHIDWSGTKSVYLALWDANDAANGTFKDLGDTQVDAARPGSFRVLGIEEMDAYGGYGGAIQVRVHTKG